MNLLQRLKPEVLQAMEAEEHLYPSLIAKLKRELEEEVISPLYLTVNTSSVICQYNKTNLDIVNLLDCFNK
jgi:hypothetical protein